MPPPIRRPEESEQRRCTILQAARSVFARDGYTESTVEDIAALAGMAKGTLYLYFRSKEQIYMAALMASFRQINARLRAAMEAAATWDDKLKAYVRVRLQAVGEEPDFFRIYLTEFRNMCLFSKPHEAEFYHLVQEGESLLTQLFTAATARGEMRPVDPELAAQTVMDITRGLIERRLRTWGRPYSQADEEFALDLLCRALERK